MAEKKVKQSLLVGVLSSSFGIFLSKVLGLVYYAPLSSIAGESNMAFYSITYTYYDLLLKVSSAGIPFAIAALVARYYAKEDYKTVFLVKKLGISLVLALSFISASFFAIFSKPLAMQSMGANATIEDIENLQTLFVILLLAVILVPFLSALRGYYQGLKRLDLYGASQVLEQFVRVSFIVIAAYVAVKVLDFDSIYAVYMAIAAAGIAAFVSIVFFMLMTKDDDRHVSKLIKEQEGEAQSSIAIFKEILSLGIPYLVISFLGSLAPLINTTFFIDTATKSGMALEEAKLSLGILQANCNKISAIPQVLTLGFSAGLVPYLVESMEKGDTEKLSKQISQIVDTVLFILVPIIFIFFFFAKDVYYIMYGNGNLELGTRLFRYHLMVCFIDTIAPIFSSIMITLRYRRQAIITLILSFIVKLATFFVLVKAAGAVGMILSTFISSLVVIVAYIFVLEKECDLDYLTIGKRLLMTTIASLIMVLPVYFLKSFIPFAYDSRIIDILFMMVCGIIMLVIYYLVSVYFHLPQVIFGIKDISPKQLLRKFRR